MSLLIEGFLPAKCSGPSEIVFSAILSHLLAVGIWAH